MNGMTTSEPLSKRLNTVNSEMDEFSEKLPSNKKQKSVRFENGLVDMKPSSKKAHQQNQPRIYKIYPTPVDEAYPDIESDNTERQDEDIKKTKTTFEDTNMFRKTEGRRK